MITVSHAHPSDLPVVRDLVEGAGLPIEGLGTVPTAVFVARLDGRIVGTASVENHDGHGLLRSVAVDESQRGGGVGSQMAAAAEEHAWDLGLDAIYLLTETAEAFFAKRGYAVIGRDQGPEPIMASVEWAVACGETAVPMVLEPG